MDLGQLPRSNIQERRIEPGYIPMELDPPSDSSLSTLSRPDDDDKDANNRHQLDM